MPDVLNLADKPPEIQANIGGKPYIIRGASVAAATKYRNKALASYRMADGKMIGIDGMADAEPMLIAMCAFETYGNNGETKERPVLLSTVMAWPEETQAILFEKIKELSPRLIGGKDVEPKMIAACRKDLAEQHHPDRGGDENVMRGINLALDWLKEHVKDEAKKAAGAATGFSA